MKTVYTDQDQTAISLNENEGCTKVTILEPSIREEDSQILFKTKVHIVTSLSKERLSEIDRQILLDTLLETRHRFHRR